MSGDLTRDEASEKWCPFAWGGRRVTEGDRSRCISSECMAWRWRGSSAVIDRTGYCGLAGDHL